jgi:hypothetical protein
MIRISDAIITLKPNSEWTIRGNDYSQLEWLDTDTTKPTKSEIDAEIIRLQAVEDTQLYARNRKEEYDALNQFELISDDAAGSTTTHVDAIAAIKTKWPKNNKGPIE